MKYGSREVTLKLERETTRLVHREPSVNASPDKFRKLLATHLPFSGRRVSNVGIVVADKTRLCQYSTYLPVLTGYLQESGIPPSGITFYIAYGTHAPQSEQECIESYGETYKQFRFVHHNSRDTGAFQALGTTSRGTSVKLASEVLQHDMLITFGAILHHYFAGYGGGRKLLFPGMGAYESILQNHRLFLDYKTRSPAAGCLSGQLDHNPLALDLEEISGLLPPHLEIYTILDSQKQVCEISAGTSYEEFRKVCQRYDLFFKSTEMQQFDLVVASAGGYPKDINFIQSHKSIQNAASFVKNGGKLIIFAECRDGIGNPGLMGLFRLGGKDNIFRELEVEYKNNAGTAISMLEKAERMEIRMVTTLSEEDCRFMGATRCLPEDVQHMIDSEKGSVAVLENAGMLYR
jgi:nickel-dependent lactate racemase